MADYFNTSQLQLTRNYLDGDFNDVVFNSKHDPLTGIDTGSGNDHLTGNDMWSPAPECTYTSEPDGNDPIVHHVGGSAGPGGTSYLTGYAEAVGLDSSTVDVMNNFTNFAMPVGDFI